MRGVASGEPRPQQGGAATQVQQGLEGPDLTCKYLLCLDSVSRNLGPTCSGQPTMEECSPNECGWSAVRERGDVCPVWIPPGFRVTS